MKTKTSLQSFGIPFLAKHEIKLVAQILCVSCVVWLFCVLLRLSIHTSMETLFEFLNHVPIWFLFFPLILGAFITAVISKFHQTTIHYRDSQEMVHPLPDIEGDGLERAIALYFASEPMLEQTLMGTEGVEARWDLPTFSLAFRKWVATWATLGFGGSGGLEASVALIGESVASGLFKPSWWNRWLGRWLFITNPDELETLQMAGISAAISTLLHAPFASAFFSIEVMYRKRPNVEKLLFACIASLTAFLLSNLSGNSSSIFHLVSGIRPKISFELAGLIVLQSVIIVFVAQHFGKYRQVFRNWLKSRVTNHWLRHLSGAVLTGSVAIIAVLITRYWLHAYAPEWEAKGFELVLGPGEEMIDLALAGKITIQIALLALFAKSFATIATLGGGGSAGLLIPSLFIGTMVAATFSSISGIPAPWLIAPAMTASLVAIVNVPLAAILIVAELFSSAYIPVALIALIVSGLFSHGYSIYRSQRESNRQREILPGYAVRRIPVKPDWVGYTLIELDLRNRYGINVIGFIDNRPNSQESAQIHLSTQPDIPLQWGDVLLIIGKASTLIQLVDEK